MKQLKKFWRAILNFKIRIQGIDLLLTVRNSFISLLGIKIGAGATRYLLFFSYDPIALRLELFFLDFTPGYKKKAEDYAVKLKEDYMKLFERMPHGNGTTKKGKLK